MLLYALLPLQHLWSRLASFQVLSGHMWLLFVYSDEWGGSGCSGLAHSWVLETLRGSPGWEGCACGFFLLSSRSESWSYKKSYQLGIDTLICIPSWCVFANFRGFFL